MDSDFQQQQYQHHFQDLQRQFHHQKQQVNSLTRFRSAPSSYFASFLDAADTITNTGGASGGGGGGGERERGDFANVRGEFSARPLSPETENIFARFMSSMGAENNSSSHKLSDIPENLLVQPESMVRVKQESDTMLLQQQQQQQQQHHQQANFNTSSKMIYQSPSKPPLANQQNSATAVSSAMGSSFRGVSGSSMGMNSIPHMKTGVGGCNNSSTSSLTRHSSSPAGFFANLNVDGYGIMRSGMANYGGVNAGNDQMNFSSGQPSSSSGLMTQNPDVGAKIERMNSLEETRFNNPSNNQNTDSNNYISGFPMSSWDDSILSDNFNSLDRGGDDDRKFSDLNASDNQTGEGRNRPPRLAHHLSLPSGEISALEKLFHLQDSVPLRIRAKRGCATHPRSIAERVRRTKISERMRKLQDLVPNMDKQTNTADMLDLAVDYIKELQKQVKVLDDNRAKCTCPK